MQKLAAFAVAFRRDGASIDDNAIRMPRIVYDREAAFQQPLLNGTAFVLADLAAERENGRRKLF